MSNFINKTFFWIKLYKESILNFLAYFVAPLLVIFIVAWLCFA